MINRSVELFKVSSIEDGSRIFFIIFHRENISNIYTFIYNYFFVYISDNSLNSFESHQYLQLENGSFNVIEIEKAYFETKSQSLSILVRTLNLVSLTIK